MKVYFEGEKNVFVFKPTSRKKRGFQTNEQRLKAMDTESLAKELALIAEWDRAQVNRAKNGPGLVEFIKKWLESRANEET